MPRRADALDPVPPPIVPRVAVRPDELRDPEPADPKPADPWDGGIEDGVVGDTDPASGGADPGNRG